MIQILVKTKVFFDFFQCLTSTRNIGKKNIDQSIKDSSHKIMKEMQLLSGKRYPPHIICHEIESLSHLFQNRCLITLEGGETPIAYCSL